MAHLLTNPVYNALCTGDSHFNQGSSNVKYFEESVSPFAGFAHDYQSGFEELHELLPVGRKILYANPEKIKIPQGWRLMAEVAGTQFVLDNYLPLEKQETGPVPLDQNNIEEMIKLTALTKPGPFDKRTIEFGHYFGIFQKDQLAAMTGQRLHVSDYTEISAVCTHPDHLGKGFAGTLLHHQIDLILKMNQTPFLHVRSDNLRAIALYERTGFKASRPMNFYFLKKE